MKPSVSLMFFASEAGAVGPRYELVLESARQADASGLTSVWLPERHFHKFGGPFPNPAVLAAAVAGVTRRIRIRAGSIVLPLHDPIRVAEDWAMVDNLSGGRVDVAFATGWDADSFVLAPDRYESRIAETFQRAREVEECWQGTASPRPNGQGRATSIRIYPTPVQKTLNVWITATRRDALFEEAGRAGYHVLTALLFQSWEELARRIAIYRQARALAGHDPSAGVVTLMLHTFLAETTESARAAVRGPLRRYLGDSIELWGRESGALAGLSGAPRDEVLDIACERYLRTSALVGSPADAHAILTMAERAGVNEVAALVDFGPTQLEVLETVRRLGACV